MGLVIKISDETEAMLAAIKHPGQTWDGIIQELIQRDQDKKQADKK